MLGDLPSNLLLSTKVVIPQAFSSTCSGIQPSPWYIFFPLYLKRISWFTTCAHHFSHHKCTTLGKAWLCRLSSLHHFIWQLQREVRFPLHLLFSRLNKPSSLGFYSYSMYSSCCLSSGLAPVTQHLSCRRMPKIGESRCSLASAK